MKEDTIYALATPLGGAIAVVRISGPEAKAVLSRVFSGKIADRHMAHGAITGSSGPLDSAMAVHFQGPRSYTGEDMAEIYLHGGYGVVRPVLKAISEAGARSAQPGEFTKRAFLNGKMDLAEAEAVMDLVQSRAERGAQSALLQLSGALSERVNAIFDTLADALSGVDAAIDYPEEMEEDVFSALPGILDAALSDMETLIHFGIAAKSLREGLRVVIAGRPNAGKSSLLNALLGEERAIVTPAEGTTRDVIEAETVIEGVPVRLFDTAGLRESEDQAESLGVQRALLAMERADWILVALDAEEQITDRERQLLQEAKGRGLAVISKRDLNSGAAAFAAAQEAGVPALGVSALTGEGLEALKKEIALRAAPDEGEGCLITNMRHVEALRAACEAVHSAKEAKEADCVATDLHAALAALGSITGRNAGAEVIDRIFAQFCVGK